MNKNINKLGFFRFKKFKNRILLTNDVGEFIFLNNKEFGEFTNGKIKKGDKKFIELKEKNFIRNDKLVELFIEKYKIKKNYLFSGPSLHIVVLTTACNYNCIYCQTSSSAGNTGKSCGTMTKETARKTVNFIFSSPNNKIAIEFQGGEPMLNWNVLKFITEYAISKNKEAKKDLELRLVSNLSQMTMERLRFCFDNKISISTSLDGP
ncbi:4Fe-4S cluster-binding domain-containing protein, partial [bacterium]|nr:4Fe-4S cluster-binding domain-containing protein [bacterium]